MATWNFRCLDQVTWELFYPTAELEMISFELYICYKIRTTCYWCSSWIFWVSLEDSQSSCSKHWKLISILSSLTLWHHFCKHLVALLLVFLSQFKACSFVLALHGVVLKKLILPHISVTFQELKTSFDQESVYLMAKLFLLLSQKSSGNEKADLLSCSSSQLLSNTGHRPLSKWPVYFMVMALVSFSHSSKGEDYLLSKGTISSMFDQQFTEDISGFLCLKGVRVEGLYCLSMQSSH